MAKCTVCHGDKLIPGGGAWSTIYDEDAKKCPHCRGTGEEPEPEEKPNRSSPFEDEGTGIGSSNNP